MIFSAKSTGGRKSSLTAEYINTAAETVEVLAAENKAISEEVVNQMLPICYQFRDESLLQMRNNSTIAVGINFLTVLAGTVVGTWVAIPPTQERQEIMSIQPILIGVGIGEIIGLILALIIIWKSNKNESSI